MPSSEEHEELANTAVVLGNAVELDDIRPTNLQIVVIGNGAFATHTLPENASLTIGRSKRCDIPIDEQSISRQHAVLKIGERLTLEDLGSVNGTFVRGRKLTPRHPATISIGELVSIGKVSIILQQRSRPLRARRLWTHDYFEARLEEECAREQRSGAAFALLHILPEPATEPAVVEELLGELVRDSDILGKYGPDVYEVLLPDTPISNAEDAVRRIASRLIEGGLKCQIFVACCPRDGHTPDQLTARVKALVTQEKPGSSGDIVVSDPQMLSLHRMVEQIADSNIGVLLLGETGVGKEVFARAVHRASSRASGPFVELNCAALTETLLESELFGHEKGAFTDAHAAKPGLVEMADGGTLLLDEVGDMPVSTQAKLLRVIENAELRRVGGLKARPIDVRFVAATNSDLEAQVAMGRFRRDLFFRLNGVTIVIPPLRDRLAELEPLARAFIQRVRPNGSARALTADALELLQRYSWPGNVRELKNMMERAVLLSRGGPIKPEHLPVEKIQALRFPRARSSGEQVAVVVPNARTRGSTEEQQIVNALERAGGNQTLAARLLGISRRTLVNRLNEYKNVHRPRKHKKPRS